MLRQLPAKADVSDVKEKGRTTNSHASNNESKNGYWQSIGMPCPLLPSVRKIIHCCSELLGTQNGKQSEREEECCHYERCGYVATTGNGRLHTSEMYHRAKLDKCYGDISTIDQRFHGFRVADNPDRSRRIVTFRFRESPREICLALLPRAQVESPVPLVTRKLYPTIA